MIHMKDSNLVKQSRSVGLDLIRCLAIFCIIAVHFFGLHTPFYCNYLVGHSMFLQGVCASFFTIGVPLFVMLTGYLSAHKQLSWKYYRGGARVLGSYVFFSVVLIAFRALWLGEQHSVLEWGLKVLNFSAVPYGWYLEMWIGLFLLAPFLNILWGALPRDSYKYGLIATIALISVVPNSLNGKSLCLMPGFWGDMWPLLGYFIGVLVREKQYIVRAISMIWLVIVLSLVYPTASVLYVEFVKAGVPGAMRYLTGMGTVVFPWLIALPVFLLLYRRDTRCEWLRRWLASVSKASLDMYLCCYMFDALFYPFFMEHYYESQA